VLVEFDKGKEKPMAWDMLSPQVVPFRFSHRTRGKPGLVVFFVFPFFFFFLFVFFSVFFFFFCLLKNFLLKNGSMGAETKFSEKIFRSRVCNRLFFFLCLCRVPHPRGGLRPLSADTSFLGRPTFGGSGFSEAAPGIGVFVCADSRAGYWDRWHNLPGAVVVVRRKRCFSMGGQTFPLRSHRGPAENNRVVPPKPGQSLGFDGLVSLWAGFCFEGENFTVNGFRSFRTRFCVQLGRGRFEIPLKPQMFILSVFVGEDPGTSSGPLHVLEPIGAKKKPNRDCGVPGFDGGALITQDVRWAGAGGGVLFAKPSPG